MIMVHKDEAIDFAKFEVRVWMISFFLVCFYFTKKHQVTIWKMELQVRI